MHTAVKRAAKDSTGAHCDNGLTTLLQQALPAGAHVAVCWGRAGNPDGAFASGGADAGLREQARGLLEDRVDDVLHQAHAGPLATAWDTGDGTRAALVASVPQPPSAELAQAWRLLARRLLGAHLAAQRAQARIESLEKSERLQQALYEIADLAGSELEMAEMLRRIHALVAGLMYAENFYIVLYDDVRDTLRFLYFADQLDPYVADAGKEIAASGMANSITMALLRYGEPLRGSSTVIREQLGLGTLHDAETAGMEKDQGPESLDWLGVPMRRDERVCGAIVVQSYDRPDSYADEERTLLAYVAQHILTALDRRQARQELERRVEERTHELQLSNRDLQAEIVERQRAERLQRALFRIAELSITADTLEWFYAQVHDVVSGLLYARNFYIALLSEDGQRLQFPYSIDEHDQFPTSRALAGGLTEYVIEQGRALLADRSKIGSLEKRGAARSVGELAYFWLGVPLLRDDVVVGVIAVQSYSPAVVFTARDQELLTFVAHHIGIGLMRKQAQDRLVAAHSDLELRVDSRTRELAEANAKLVSQIGERLRAEEQLTHQALHDALTGLPNRTQLLGRLEQAVQRAQRDPTFLFAVLFMDLDRFKLVNDSAGHSAGDELLIEAGRRIVGTVRGHDTVARLGGDEFAILIEGIPGLAVAENLASRVHKGLGAPCWVAGHEVFPAASIGIALWHPRYSDGAELLRDADAAMYRAKSGGRNNTAVFDEAMRDDAIRTLDLEGDLRRAINGEGFVAFFQPIVRLTDMHVVGHEALLRWNHERRGLLAPGAFIGLGEDSGLIEQIDWIIYQQVIARLARGGEGYISINVSPRHFRTDDFTGRLLGLLDASGADPGRLRIEITEVSLFDDVPRAVDMLRLLRGRGVLAQLDDFGTGFSALSYLHRFPLECLKIDRSFVSGLVGETEMESVAVVRAVQALAGTLGIHTIGEGIETIEQRDSLLELGCSYGQGYLLGRPAPEPVPIGPLVLPQPVAFA